MSRLASRQERGASPTGVSPTLQRVIRTMQDGTSVIRRVVTGGGSNGELCLCTAVLSEDFEKVAFVKEGDHANMVSHLHLSGIRELETIEEGEAPGISMRIRPDEDEPTADFRLQIIFSANEMRNVWFAGLSVLTDDSVRGTGRSDGRKSPEVEEGLVEENRRLRLLLQARDATIADLMAMVSSLIARQQTLLDDLAAPRAEAEAEVEAAGPSAEEEEMDRLREELEAKIGILEERKTRLESLLLASKDALEEQLASG